MPTFKKIEIVKPKYSDVQILDMFNLYIFVWYLGHSVFIFLYTWIDKIFYLAYMVK